YTTPLPLSAVRFTHPCLAPGGRLLVCCPCWFLPELWPDWLPDFCGFVEALFGRPLTAAVLARFTPWLTFWTVGVPPPAGCFLPPAPPLLVDVEPLGFFGLGVIVGSPEQLGQVGQAVDQGHGVGEDAAGPFHDRGGDLRGDHRDGDHENRLHRPHDHPRDQVGDQV